MHKSGFILKNLNKKYLLGDDLHIVLNNLSIEISNEEITVILGESGCGKTTLLKILSNLENADSGEISYYDNSKKKSPKVGVVFQESRLMPWLTVGENICFHCEKKMK